MKISISNRTIFLFLVVIALVVFVVIGTLIKGKTEHFTNNKNGDVTNMICNNIYCINLARSKDRWNYIRKVGKEQNLKINRYDGFDGTKLNMKQVQNACTPTYFNIMKNNKSIRGNVGCYYSHLGLIKQIYESGVDYALIIEDDVVFRKNFKQELRKVLRNIPNKWDIIYLGITRPCGKRVGENIYTPSIKKCRFDNGGAFGYILNHRSAGKIYKLLDRKISKMVDHTIRDNFNRLNVYIIYPFLINHNYGLASDRKHDKFYNNNYINASQVIKVIG